MNITELARKLKITPQELKEELPNLGIHLGQRAIQIPDKQAEKAIELWQAKKEKEKALSRIKDKMTRAVNQEEEEEEKKEVILPPLIQVYRLAEKLDLPIKKIMNELIKNGVLASVNENLDYEISAIIAENLGFKPQLGAEEQSGENIYLKDKIQEIREKEGQKNLELRAPVVVMMGHVDHGKSSILDTIRKSKIVDQEKGGITQHIGAYQVKEKNKLITFIDTPGHEAFKTMRARGGEIADLAVLVIAADDGVQPQTMESIKIIQQQNIPFLVAINKIDKAEVDIERVKKDLSEINLTPEDWGGKIICVPVSAQTGEGIDNLLETINLIMEMEKQGLQYHPQGELIGGVVEAHLDKGVGPVISAIIYNGTLKKGDDVVVGKSFGRARTIKNQQGEEIKEATASLPVQIFGIKGLPQAGDLIREMKESKKFKREIKENDFSSESEMSSINYVSSEKKQKEKSINIVLRADVNGSLEAIVQILDKLKNPEVKINILKKGLGNLTEADFELAKASNGWLISFGTGITNSARQLAEEADLRVNKYEVIYNLADEVREEINKILPPEIFEEKIGRGEVLKVFQKSSRETILGARVLEGKIIKDALLRVWTPAAAGQDPSLKGEGRTNQLQVNKKDVSEVKLGVEFGLKFLGKIKIEEGDILEIYQEIKKVKKI